MSNLTIAAVALLALAAAGCGAGGRDPAAGAEKRSDAMNSRPEAARPSGAGEGSQGPADSIRAFSEAVQRKDAEGVKQLLTKGSLAMLEGGAAAKGMSVDEFIVNGGDMPFREMPEIVGERIEGDAATVDVRYLGESDRVALERVDGVWKLAFDKG